MTVGFGEAATAGDGLTAGDAVIAGDGFAAGLAIGEAVVAGSLTGVLEPATSCHCPLRRAYVSMKRYWPLISIVLPSCPLYLPFFMTLRPLTTAASLLSTFTLRSITSQESALSAPVSISLTSVVLPPMLPSG